MLPGACGEWSRLTAANVLCWMLLCLGGSGWKADVCAIQPLHVHPHHSIFTWNERPAYTSFLNYVFIIAHNMSISSL
jgi:hypothetical protein